MILPISVDAKLDVELALISGGFEAESKRGLKRREVLQESTKCKCGLKQPHP
jgi:hypothetical protein